MTTALKSRTARAAMYARISSDDLRDGLGVERQLADLREFCAREGWVAAEYVDNDFGASTYSKRRRPEFERMLVDVQAGSVDVVVVMELSRFTRDPGVIESLIAAQEGGVRLVSLQGGEYDPETATGKMRLRTEAMVAASYADFVSDKVKRKKQELVESGSGPGGSRAFGYLGADPKIGRRAGTEIDKAEARAFRAAVADVLSGASLTAVARRWNAAGFRTPRTGSLWGVPSVRAALVNPRHAGLLARGTYRTKEATRPGAKPTKVFTGYEIIGPANWPAIISRAEHDRLVRLLSDPARRRKNPPRRSLLTGFLFCGCGASLRSDGAYYRCRVLPEIEPQPCGRCAIRADELNAYVIDAVLEDLAQSTTVKRAMRAPKATRPRRGDDPDEIQRDLDELADLAGKGELPMREYLIARKPLQERLTAAQAARGAAVDAAAAPMVLADFAAGGDIPALWKRRDLDQQRQIVGLLIDRIIVKPGTGFDRKRVRIKPKG